MICGAEGEKPRTAAGMLREASCTGGVEGSRYFYCRTSGEWATTVSHCSMLVEYNHLPIDTPKCPSESFGGINYPQTDAGASATIPCGQGFSGSYTRACSATGVWESPTNNCGKWLLLDCYECSGHPMS